MRTLTPTMLFGIFVAILGAALTGTLTSPMTASTKMVVSGGLLIFGFLSFFLGVEYGSTR
jgi:hypothetical protein